MTDLISREAVKERLIEDLKGTSYDYNDKDFRMAMVALLNVWADSFPTIDPVKHGKWIDNKVAFHLVCSECGCTVRMDKGQVFDRFEDEYNYCPNCGAKNGGEGETD